MGVHEKRWRHIDTGVFLSNRGDFILHRKKRHFSLLSPAPHSGIKESPSKRCPEV